MEIKRLEIKRLEIKRLRDWTLDGFVLRLLESEDTVFTYNLPSGIVTDIEISEDYYLFNKEKRDSLHLIVTYRRAAKEELYYPLCPAIIPLARYSRAVGDKQVIVINANRAK